MKDKYEIFNPEWVAKIREESADIEDVLAALASPSERRLWGIRVLNSWVREVMKKSIPRAQTLKIRPKP